MSDSVGETQETVTPEVVHLVTKEAMKDWIKNFKEKIYDFEENGEILIASDEEVNSIFNS